MPEFTPDRDEVIKRAWEAGLRLLLCPADVTDSEGLVLTLGLSRQYPWIAGAGGVHPHQAKEFQPHHLEKIRSLAKNKEIVAIGEVGLDYHYNLSPPEKQRKAFHAQLTLAEELDLPVIIHSRKAGAEINVALEKSGFTRGAVLHCFTEDWETARLMLDRGFYISFSGILTYPNAGEIREIAAKVPAERLLVETDSPYLVPAPQRGRLKRNEPAFVIETARRLAEVRQVGLEKLAAVLRHNFSSLFRL
jgi:TatD DNase family protein